MYLLRSLATRSRSVEQEEEETEWVRVCEEPEEEETEWVGVCEEKEEEEEAEWVGVCGAGGGGDGMGRSV